MSGWEPNKEHVLRAVSELESLQLGGRFAAICESIRTACRDFDANINTVYAMLAEVIGLAKAIKDSALEAIVAVPSAPEPEEQAA